MSDTSTLVDDHDVDGNDVDGSDADDGNDDDQEQPSSLSRRRFHRAAAIGGVLGGIVFVWMVTGGSFDLFRWQLRGNFYDEQVHSFLRGELAIPPGPLGIEGFLGRGGHTYMYQGPVPALLRLPIVAITGRSLDGRLTELSMIAALVVMLVFATRLHWTVRELVRGSAAVGRGEAWLVGLFTFVLAGGSLYLYVASRAWVYHEAIVWGAALALAAVDRLVAVVRRPTAGALAWCSGLTAATLLTRASVGLGPLLGLAMVTAGAGLGMLAARRGKSWPWVAWLAPGTRDARRRPHLAGFVLAVVLPVVAYAGLNFAKFGTLFSIPFAGQRFTVVDPGRQAMLRDNGGTLFGLQFTPTTILHYLRPDGLALTKTFPFVDFPAVPGRVIGDVTFDLVDRTASLPAVVPFLLVLAIVGVAFAFRPSRWSDSGRATLRVPILAATAGAATILPFGFIANRYLGDFVPLLALAGAAGLQVLLATTRKSGDSKSVDATTGTDRWRMAGVGVLVLLAAWTCWANLGLALRYQREWSPNVPPAVLAGFLGAQDSVERRLGGDGLGPVELIGAGDPLPDGVGRAGALVIVGDCEALYLSDGMDVNSIKVTPWNGVERAQGSAHRRFRITIPERKAGTIVPILTAGTSDEPFGILLEYLGDDQVRFVYRSATGPTPRTEQPFEVDFDKEYDLDVVTDEQIGLLEARLGDATRLESLTAFEPTGRPGRNDVYDDVATRYPGELHEERITTPLCDRLLARIDPGS
ncbi:MAG: hypothetical protein ABW033_02200 [Acidimicrobiia bacterium]